MAEARFSREWWTGGQGWSGVSQWPNPAIFVWMIATGLRWSGWFDAERTAALAGIAHGALLVWAADELFRGTNPLRRLMGAVVIGVLLVVIFA